MNLYHAIYPAKLGFSEQVVLEVIPPWNTLLGTFRFWRQFVVSVRRWGGHLFNVSDDMLRLCKMSVHQTIVQSLSGEIQFVFCCSSNDWGVSPES